MVENRTLSDERIAEAPAGLRALFHEFEETHVFDALTLAGINCDPTTVTPTRMAEGIAAARKILEAQRRRDQEAMFASFQPAPADKR